MEIKFYRNDEGRGCVSAWRQGPAFGQPDIDGYYEPQSGDVGAICGATEAEADAIAVFVDGRAGSSDVITGSVPMPPQDLVIVGLRGGDASDATAAVCVDLDPGDVRPTEWSALVRRSRLRELLNNTGAELVGEPEPWDGSTFGDGAGGTVEFVDGAVVGSGLNARALEGA